MRLTACTTNVMCGRVGVMVPLTPNRGGNMMPPAFGTKRDARVIAVTPLNWRAA